MIPLVIVALAVGAAWWRMASGPLAFDAIADRVAQALEAQFGNGYDVNVRHAEVEWTSDGPALNVTGVTVRDAEGNLVVAAPQAEIGFTALSLLGGNFIPRNISFLGLAVTLTIAPDGAVSISATGEDDQMQPAPAPSGAPTDTSFGPGAILNAIASHSGPIAVLERAGIRDGRLRINDRRRGRAISYDRMSMGFQKVTGSQVAARISAQGLSGVWSLSATIDGTPGEERLVRVETRDLPLSEIVGIAQPGAIPVSTDMPISGSVALKLDRDSNVAELDGRLTGGSAVVLVEDPDAKPIYVDRLGGAFGWDAKARTLIVRNVEVKAGDTKIDLAGTVVPPRPDFDHWQVELSARNATLAGESVRDRQIQIELIALSARMPIGLGAIFIERLEIAGPEIGLSLTAAAGRAEGIDGLRVKISSKPTQARTLLAFWPSFIAAEARSYLQDAVLGGRVDSFELSNSFTPQVLADAVAKRPIPDDAVRIDVAISGGILRPAPGMAVLSDITATAHGTGRALNIAIPRAMGPGFGTKPLVFANGRYAVDDLSRKPAIAQIEFDVSGGLDSMFDVLRAEGLKRHVGISLDPATVKGIADARVKIVLPLQPGVKPADVSVVAVGSASGVTTDLGGRDKLEGGTFTFTQDRGGLVLKGDGRLTGTPASIELRQPPNAPVDVNVSLILDDAARLRRGIKLGGQLAGPVDVKVSIHDAFGSKPVTKVDVDLAKATINDLLPGWDKPAGKAGKASFRLEGDTDATGLEDLVLDATGGVSARGSVRFSADGTLIAARFSSLKLGTGEDMKVDIDRQGAVLRANIKAGTLDARPMLRSLMSPRSSPMASPADLDIDLKAQTILGENGEKLSLVDLKSTVRSGEFRDFKLSGRFGNSPVSGQMARVEGNASGIVVESGDAGGFLRFADIYRRMVGGTLLLQLTGAAPTMSGTLIANDFSLANEPALARVAGQGGAEGASNVAFTKLRAGFTVGNGRLEIREGTMLGPAVGGTLEGAMDFNRDKVDLSGTFVPAYGLNNIVSQVPIVGPILGGGRNEGLFGVNFRITGKVTQPVLSINPLSAVAPGFLRKFFGVVGPSEVPATGATTTPRPAAPAEPSNPASANR